VPRRRGLTDKQVARLTRKEDRYTLPDPEQPGHYLRIPPRSSRAPTAFAAVARDPHGKQIWITVGTADAIGIDRARELTREAIPAHQSWKAHQRARQAHCEEGGGRLVGNAHQGAAHRTRK
jgi:hypothetical protein